jgi:poly(A)-specific ribonuclease
MDVTRSEFEQSFAYISASIQNATFITIDTEFTGLYTEETKPSTYDTHQTRYTKLIHTINQFQLIQLGICTFTYDTDRAGYVARPFNFYVSPCMHPSVQSDRWFSCQASSLEFLARNHFDFNRWIHQGIPYLTKEQEEGKRRHRENEASGSMEDIGVDDKGKVFLDTMRHAYLYH